MNQRPQTVHKIIIKELEKVAKGETLRLMINLPPGSAKSTYSSDLFPPWFLAQKPNQNIIAASNTGDLAESFSKRVLDRIRQNSATLGYGLRDENVKLWRTTNGGQYRSAGVGGLITGLRADCVHENTMVETPFGFIPIKNVVVGSKTGEVLSYDWKLRLPAFRKVIAIFSHETIGTFRVQTALGFSVNATSNHRFWTQRGWVETVNLIIGDVLSTPRHGETVVTNVSCETCSTRVYDIQVEETSCFYANGLLTHNCALIDDPTKSREEAESPTIRDKQWGWFTGDLRTRLKPNASIIVLATRWHQDDLCGRLLERQPGLWKVISIPAIANSPNDPLQREIGEYLWDDDPSYPYGAELRRTHAEFLLSGANRDWSALYQQDPKPPGGSLFKTNMISVIDAEPADGHSVRAWDLAATKQTGTRDPDWTVGAKMCRLPSGRVVITDIVRIRGDVEEVEATIVNTAAQDGKRVAISLPRDPGQAGIHQAAYYVGKLAGYNVTTSPETGDKATRASPLASQVNVGNISILNRPWNTVLLAELSDFPSGSKDDQVDALSRGYSMLAEKPKLTAAERMKAQL